MKRILIERLLELKCLFYFIGRNPADDKPGTGVNRTHGAA